MVMLKPLENDGASSCLHEAALSGCRVVLRRDLFPGTKQVVELGVKKSSETTSSNQILDKATSIIPGSDSQTDVPTRVLRSTVPPADEGKSKKEKSKIVHYYGPKRKIKIKKKKSNNGARFVLLKTDLINLEYPPIWRIDGKALLQKFVHYIENGNVYYKNTSTYSGWSENNKSLYHVASVEHIEASGKDIIVQLHQDLLQGSDSEEM